MSNVLSLNAVRSGVMVSFGDRYTASEQFEQIFKEGMALVERTAAYLDGEGRKEARRLKAPVSVVYASESMRLTTRLLELASWLLIRRGQKRGELSAQQATEKRQRVSLSASGRPTHVLHFDELPAGLRQLIEESFKLNDRIARLDRAIETPVTAVATDGGNPVGAQIDRLNTAFSPSAVSTAQH